MNFCRLSSTSIRHHCEFNGSSEATINKMSRTGEIIRLRKFKHERNRTKLSFKIGE